jgi:hypothetical protein
LSGRDSAYSRQHPEQNSHSVHAASLADVDMRKRKDKKTEESTHGDGS